MEATANLSARVAIGRQRARARLARSRSSPWCCAPAPRWAQLALEAHGPARSVARDDRRRSATPRRMGSARSWRLSERWSPTARASASRQASTVLGLIAVLLACVGWMAVGALIVSKQPGTGPGWIFLAIGASPAAHEPGAGAGHRRRTPRPGFDPASSARSRFVGFYLDLPHRLAAAAVPPLSGWSCAESGVALGGPWPAGGDRPGDRRLRRSPPARSTRSSPTGSSTSIPPGSMASAGIQLAHQRSARSSRWSPRSPRWSRSASAIADPRATLREQMRLLVLVAAIAGIDACSWGSSEPSSERSSAGRRRRPALLLGAVRVPGRDVAGRGAGRLPRRDLPSRPVGHGPGDPQDGAVRRAGRRLHAAGVRDRGPRADPADRRRLGDRLRADAHHRGRSSPGPSCGCDRAQPASPTGSSTAGAPPRTRCSRSSANGSARPTPPTTCCPRMAHLLVQATGARRADVWLRVGDQLRCEASVADRRRATAAPTHPRRRDRPDRTMTTSPRSGTRTNCWGRSRSTSRRTTR